MLVQDGLTVDIRSIYRIHQSIGLYYTARDDSRAVMLLMCGLIF